MQKIPLKQPDIFSDGYDENLYGDEEDVQHLMSLTEIERESILFKRAQQAFLDL